MAISKTALNIDVSKLCSLHATVAEVLLVSLKDPTGCNPKVLEAAIRFLDNNGINASPIEGESEEDRKRRLTELLEGLPQENDFGEPAVEALRAI